MISEWGGMLGFDLIKLTYSTYLERQACANNADPDQTLQNVASDQGLYCLPRIQQFYIHSKVVKIDLWKRKS